MKNREVIQFAVVPPGFEQVCARELRHLGIVPESLEAGGVTWRGRLRELYLANLWLRSASRVLVRFAELNARDFPTLFRKAVRLPWGEFVRPGQPVAFRISCRQSRLVHRDRIAETLTLAAHQALGQPEPNPELPPQMFVGRFFQDCLLLSADSSGDHLHRRGYRTRQGEAPLRENLAAGMLLAVGYEGGTLVDPFCGSGTLAIEAALIAGRRAPGRHRSFAFMHWPGFRDGLWNLLLQEADRAAVAIPDGVIHASDSDPEMVAVARANAAMAGLESEIDWSCRDALDLEPPASRGLWIANPPYGERLGEPAAVRTFCRRLGDRLDHAWAGWRRAVLLPDPALLGPVQRTWSRMPLRNGGLKVWFVGEGIKTDG